MDLGDEVTTQVKGFVDLGATLRHQITRQWMANITVNNALNQEYELWVQYPVQGFRVNLGLQYNFDLP
jgi:outer membrane cobalamin receptor